MSSNNFEIRKFVIGGIAISISHYNCGVTTIRKMPILMLFVKTSSTPRADSYSIARGAFWYTMSRHTTSWW